MKIGQKFEKSTELKIGQKLKNKWTKIGKKSDKLENSSKLTNGEERRKI